MAAEVADTDRYYLEKEQLLADDDSDFQYGEIVIDEELVADEYDEDLEKAVRTINEAAQDALAQERQDRLPEATVTHRPEVVDDFVRNFLVKMGMSKTLDTFQTEWYELQHKGQLNIEDVGVVPDIYSKNHFLDQELKHMRVDMEKFRDAALKAKETYVKLRKERDFHRMHHKRVVQEKNKLLNDLKRLRTHYASYEPTLRQLKQKYESAMKEKMLTKLERDRAVGQVQGLQSTLKNLDEIKTGSSSSVNGSPLRLVPVQRGSAVVMVDADGRGPTHRNLIKERELAMKPSWEGIDVMTDPAIRHPDDSVFPYDVGVNPLLAKVKAAPGHLTRSGGFRLTNTFQAHSHSISGLALHPRKNILCTTSDDHTWKMWAVPGGDVIMTGEGHTDWVSDCDFHPSGSSLATVSGDTTVKVWDFARAECTQTFTDHTHAVWGCSWHTSGDFLATCSMDNTSKIWDLNSVRCRYTLRGHTDSVNSIEFLPYSNTLTTSSADKTVSLWDARTGLCAQTFFGHMHSVNHATFNLKGDTIASVDSYGVVKLFDVRTVAPMTSIDCGPHPANRLAFDPTGQVLAIASNDGTVKMYSVASGETSSLVGHEDAVQCCVFDRSGDFLVTTGSDLSVRIWS